MKTSYTHRKTLVVIAAAFALCLVYFSGDLIAQPITTPRAPSPASSVTQTIGISTVKVDYSRPAVRDREIWGALVPYGWNVQGFGDQREAPWRAGANENTTITVTDPVTIEGKSLDSGTYGVHMIPGPNEWTVIFSKVASAWGSFTYKEAEDALRVTVKPQATEFREALSYDFDQVKPDSTVAVMRWEKVSVPFNIAVNVNETVQASLHRQLRGLAQYTWEGWDDAASYYLAQKTNLDEALRDEDESIKVEERFDNLLTKSKILDQMGRKDEAKANLAKEGGIVRKCGCFATAN